MNNWQFYVSRKFNYFVEWVQTACTKKEVQEKYFGFSFPLKNYLILNGDEYYWLPDSDSYKKFLDKKYKKDKSFFSKFAKAEFKLAQNAQKTENYLKKLAPKMKRFSNTRILAVYKKFLDAYIACFATGFVRPDDFFETQAKKKIVELLKKTGNKTDADEIFKAIATYSNVKGKELDYLEEPLALLKITRSIKKKNESKDDLKNDIRWKAVNHWKRYQWLKNPNVYENLSVRQEELQNRIESQLKENIDSKIKHIIDNRKNDDKKYQALIMSLSFPGELKRFMDDLRKFIFLRTHTTESADRLFYWARQTILAEIAKRILISEEDVVAFTGDEIIEFLENGKIKPLSEINLRKKTFALVWQNGRAIIKYGKDAELLIEKYKDLRVKTFEKKEGHDMIKGQVACLGKVTGKVKVLLSHKEASKVKKGDILVVSMTTPDFITAMEKSAAFITDEGGITCHAAIVSREMNKPCIIGTKIATKVLKDGDLVEVDANKGIVKILKRN